MTDHRDIFVGREWELDQLHTLLDRTLASQGQVAFVTGEAGSGKTALVHHFCRQAQAVHANLVVATGQCDAQTGAGTPYLPFTEILRLLTGDIAEEMTDEALSQENASRLKSAVRFSVDALFAFGPDLIDVLIPGSGLMITASTFIAEQTGLSDWLAERIKRRQPATGVTQENIFEQYSNVIRKLAENHPLILVLDDLHWADTASCELLFRLGRRIEDRSVLVLGTYRPNDVAAGRDGARHPLEPVVAELTRYYGNIRVDLDQKPAPEEDEVYNFVSGYIHAAYYPHTFGDEFARLIASRTEGHPLFTVELLRDLEERGWLARDAAGCWTLTQPVVFDALPPRVEGIIEERIGRLDPDAQEMLTVAAVEGDQFTAQVIAQVQQLDEREVIRRLSRELDRQHQLVVERGVERLGRQRLYLFAFRHILFQTHLYGALGNIDRSLLHEDVGMALEVLYGDHAAEIAPELAYHFLAAGLEERALPHLIEAGDRAWRSFANQEAVEHYSRALSIIDAMLANASAEEVPELHQLQFNVLGRREEVYDRLGRRDAQAADLERMLEVASQLGEHHQAQVYNRQSHYFWVIGEYDQAIGAASRALPLMQAAGDRLGEGETRLNLGQAARETGDYEAASHQFLTAASLFDEVGAMQPQARALTRVGTLHSELGEFEEALHYLEQALDVSRQIDSQHDQAYALDQIGVIYANIGDYSKALKHSQEALAIARSIGDRFLERVNLINVAVMLAYLGDYEQAIDLARVALEISRAIHDQSGEAVALINLGDFERALGQYDPALSHLQVALSLAEQLKRPFLAAACHHYLAETYRQHESRQDAERAVEHARLCIAAAEQAGTRHYQVLGRSALAMALLARGDVEDALTTSTKAVEQLEALGAIEGPEEEVYFHHSQILQAAGRSDDAWQPLQKARDLIQAKAKRISDPALRQSFLEQVPLNRQILWATAKQR